MSLSGRGWVCPTLERERSTGHSREAWVELMKEWNTNTISCRMLRKNLLPSSASEPFVLFDPPQRHSSQTLLPIPASNPLQAMHFSEEVHFEPPTVRVLAQLI